MIRISETVLLAYTKLRARKLRLILTIIISSLLFGVLATGSFVVRGILKSTDSFAQEGFGKRYILAADSINNPNYDDPSVLQRATALQKEEIARKQAEAKKLGIEYDKATERLVTQEGDGPNGKEQFLDTTHPLAIQAVKEHIALNPLPGVPELQKLAAPYGLKAIYENRYGSAFGGFNPGGGGLKILKDGKEEFVDNNSKQPSNPFEAGLNSFTGGWTLLSGDLLKTFTLTGTNGMDTPEGSIPVVAPYTAVEQLLKLSPLPASATPSAKLARIKEVRERAGSVEFSVCYRNGTSSELISQANSAKREAEQNKNNKDYQKPSLIYDFPTEPCGAARIVRDVRSADEKALAKKHQTFRETFGEEPPFQQTLHFKVIGIAPDPPNFSTAFIDSLVGSIVASNIGTGWFTPLEYKANQPIVDKLFPDTQLFGRPNSFFVEVESPAQAKKMLDEASCSMSFEGVPGPDFDPAKACIEEGKNFMLQPFGSSSLALDSLRTGFEKVLRIAALVVTVIAGLILMGTLGRIIADSRRETAVFRAIGAKRLDIAQIYIMYTVIMILCIVVVSLLVGFALSQVAQAKWGSRFTVQALVAYNAQDLTRQFHLYGLYAKDLLFIAGAAFSAGVISAILPLLRNLRRNPIRDMRDEN